MDWNGQENFSLSCEFWVGTNDFNTKKIFLSVPIHGNFPEWKLALKSGMEKPESIKPYLMVYKKV